MPVKRVRADGHTFIFYYDREFPSMLHIWVRHMMTEDQVVDVFFEGSSFWNADHERWESYTATYYVYWGWADQVRKIVKIFSAGRN